VIDGLIARGRAAAVMIALGLLASSSPLAADITGAGATFPYPVYAKWAEAYRQQSGVDVNYLPIGSGAGVDQVKRKMVDFGASDVPLAVEDLRESQLVQFPAIIGGVVPVVNIPGVRPGELRLTG
jgi:phosphate transport system substrate-binding protein